VLSVSENVPSVPVTGNCLDLAVPAEFAPISADTPTQVEVAVTLAVTFVMAEATTAPAVAPTPTVEATPTPDLSQIPTATPPARTTTHTYQFGETLENIALRYNVSIDSILTANNLTTETAQSLQPGQTLLIPLP
jgi:LysM repeat protein